MHPVFLPRGHSVTTVPVTFVNAANWREQRAALESRARGFADAAGFEPKAGRHCLLPDADGGLAGVLFALERPEEPSKDLFWPGALPALLPGGAYRFATAAHDQRLAALAFALGAYRFTRYRKADAKEIKLELPGNVDGDDLSRIVEGVTLARDLINTPANDLGPAELEAAARTLADRHGAKVRAIVGDDLLAGEFSAHSRGRPRRRAAAPPHRSHLGRSQPSQGDAHRQGRVLRFGRARHQARERHAQHEEGHGRRGRDARAGAHAHAARHQAAAARAHPGGRERDLGRMPSARATSIARARA